MTAPQKMTTQQALDLGVKHHNAGNLFTAEKIYRKLLQTEPGMTAATHLLGVISYQKGDYQTAVELIEQALSVQPNLAAAHNNLGLALRKLGRSEAALACYRKAVSINKKYTDAYNNLGNVLRECGHLECALKNYQKAQYLSPEGTDSTFNAADMLLQLGRGKEAIQTLKTIKSPRGLVQSQGRILECLYALGNRDQFHRELEQSILKDEGNIRTAAISAFAAQQLSQPDPHPFCKDPLRFVRMYDTTNKTDQDKDFLKTLVHSLKGEDVTWEPAEKTTKGGFQTRSNLFDEPNRHVTQVEHIIRHEIENYYSGFATENCGFIDSFPTNRRLTGWFVRLVKGGYQTEHIHPSGWLSGVFYLQMPQTTDPNEGAIELGLWGYDYPVLKNNYPKQRYFPRDGSLILFPSSLFHRTIPSYSNGDRLCIAFDLLPNLD